MTSLMEISGAALLRNTHNGSVYSARHRILTHASDEDEDLSPAMDAVKALIRNGDYEIADASERPSVATCRGCGCTEELACDGGCAWIEIDEQTNVGLCSTCARRP
jgi:hypothetical protein